MNLALLSLSHLWSATRQQSHQLPLLLSQLVSNKEADDSDIIINDEVTYGRNLRSRTFGRLIDSSGEFELSDKIQFRLWLARQLAMAKYDEKWA